MWMKARTSIKVAQSNGSSNIVRASDPPFEIDEDTGAELIATGAADEVAEPVAATETNASRKNK